MKRKTASILFLIALLVVGPNAAVPVVTAAPGNDLLQEDQVSDENDDDGEDNESPDATENQNAQNSATASIAATSASLGSIQVGPSASGEAVRILSTGYKLQPLSGDVCLTCLGIIVGPGDLFTPSIIDQLRAAYEADHAVGLTNATHRPASNGSTTCSNIMARHSPCRVARTSIWLLFASRSALTASFTSALTSCCHARLPRPA